MQAHFLLLVKLFFLVLQNIPSQVQAWSRDWSWFFTWSKLSIITVNYWTQPPSVLVSRIQCSHPISLWSRRVLSMCHGRWLWSINGENDSIALGGKEKDPSRAITLFIIYLLSWMVIATDTLYEYLRCQLRQYLCGIASVLARFS